jgi:hypothetical protein
MSEKIVLVSYPDDILLEGTRILLYDLEKQQTDIVSKALVSLDFDSNIIIYSISSYDDAYYLIDKYHKSDILIFNANSENQTVVGFLAGKFNSMYFGQLRSIGRINDSEIHDENVCKKQLERMIIKYGK